MECPTCKTTQLVMSERQGIEIDYCPQCRGVWLDRGELDKIIDRSLGTAPTPRDDRSATYAPREAAPYPPPQDPRHDPRHGGHYYKKKKREGFLSEIFDFD